MRSPTPCGTCVGNWPALQVTDAPLSRLCDALRDLDDGEGSLDEAQVREMFLRWDNTSLAPGPPALRVLRLREIPPALLDKDTLLPPPRAAPVSRGKAATASQMEYGRWYVPRQQWAPRPSTTVGQGRGVPYPWTPVGAAGGCSLRRAIIPAPESQVPSASRSLCRLFLSFVF